MKKFTLTEIVVAIMIISVLLSIVLIGFLEFKKKSVASAMNSNVKIMQTAVDMYFLEHEKYPTKNELPLYLGSPRLIDVNKLIEDKKIKKDLDLSKIKDQNYWIDVFGRVWGSTEDTPSGYVLLNSNKGKSIEFTVEDGVYGYNLYEVIGYGNNGEKEPSNDNYYKLISSVKMKGKKSTVNIPIIDSNKTYLVSTIDDYELESAPVGLYNRGKNDFEPILNTERDYIFEIDGERKMYWVDFQTLQKTPGNSKIEYSFSLKGQDGKYGKPVDNFHELEPSKGIRVHVKMTADGNDKPSLYDLRVIYCYFKCTLDLSSGEDVDNIDTPEGNDEGWNNGGWENGDGWGYISHGNGEDITVLPGEDSSTDTEEGENGGSGGEGGSNGTGNAGGTGNSGGSVIKPNQPNFNNPNSDYDNLCGLGRTLNNVNSEGKLIDQTQKSYMTYLFSLKEGDYIESMNVNSLSVFYPIKSVMVEFSHLQQPFEIADSLTEIPSGSCINIVYEVELIESKEKPLPPFVDICNEDCAELCKNCIPACGEECGLDICEGSECKNDNIDAICRDKKCKEEPEIIPPPSKELEESGWKTIDTLRFYAHGNNSNIVKWTSVNKKDLQPENTKIIYTYSTSNGTGWSKETQFFEEIQSSRVLLVSAYLMVKNDFVDKVQPSVQQIFVKHEDGDINLNLYKPSLSIYPKLSNNKGRETISTTSKVEWSYHSFDPTGSKIVDVEWSGDKKEVYEEGMYVVNARIKNEEDIWSDWVSYEFEVNQEKPIAVISHSKDKVYLDTKVEWLTEKSYDPDGDKIVSYEWSGDYKSIYNKVGDYSLKLRVKDSEGYWSDWSEFKFTVLPLLDSSQNMFKSDMIEMHQIKTLSSQTMTEKERNLYTYLSKEEGYNITSVKSNNGIYYAFEESKELSDYYLYSVYRTATTNQYVEGPWVYQGEPATPYQRAGKQGYKFDSNTGRFSLTGGFAHTSGFGDRTGTVYDQSSSTHVYRYVGNGGSGSFGTWRAHVYYKTVQTSTVRIRGAYSHETSGLTTILPANGYYAKDGYWYVRGNKLPKYIMHKFNEKGEYLGSYNPDKKEFISNELKLGNDINSLGLKVQYYTKNFDLFIKESGNWRLISPNDFGKIINLSEPTNKVQWKLVFKENTHDISRIELFN